MNIAAVGAIALGVVLMVAGFIWIGSWSFPAILLGLVLAALGLLWFCAQGIDKGIKDYIDYAKEKKDDGGD